MDTRLYHDLGIRGDEAWAYLETLKRDFDVDLTEFDFEVYFPAEFPGETFLEQVFGWLFPWTRKGLAPESFAPLTLRMIDRAIDRGRWSEDEMGVE